MHVHVYRIAEMIEVDIETASVEEARTKAFLIAADTPREGWKPADCGCVAMTFEPFTKEAV